jgi:hypothetical protein
MTVDVKYGIEVECVFDNSKVPFNPASYHTNNSGEHINFWSVTNDSSLNTEVEPGFSISNPRTAEFVSDASIGIEEMMDYLTEFKKKLSADGRYELKEVLNFNKSCGMHIHFSTWRARENQMLTMAFYKKLKERTFDRVKVELPTLYKDFVKHYSRSYNAPQDNILINKGIRGEFNYTSLNKGIEWRAFNLKGVKSWDEMFHLIRIGLEEIQKIMNEYYDCKFTEEFEEEITPEELARIKQEIKDEFTLREE